jgi:hypothetical protein
MLSSSIGGLEFLLPVVVCIEEYTRVRDYEKADTFNAGFGEDEVDGFAGVGAAPAGGDVGQVEECADYVVGVAGFRRRGCVSEGRDIQGVIRGVLSRPLGDVWGLGG